METRARRRSLGPPSKSPKKVKTIRAPIVTESEDATSDKSDEEIEEPTKKSNLPVVPENPEQKMKKIITRTVIACAMIAFYMVIINAGHLYCILVAVLVQVCVFVSSYLCVVLTFFIYFSFVT